MPRPTSAPAPASSSAARPARGSARRRPGQAGIRDPPPSARHDRRHADQGEGPDLAVHRLQVGAARPVRRRREADARGSARRRAIVVSVRRSSVGSAKNSASGSVRSPAAPAQVHLGVQRQQRRGRGRRGGRRRRGCRRRGRGAGSRPSRAGQSSPPLSQQSKCGLRKYQQRGRCSRLPPMRRHVAQLRRGRERRGLGQRRVALADAAGRSRSRPAWSARRAVSAVAGLLDAGRPAPARRLMSTRRAGRDDVGLHQRQQVGAAGQRRGPSPSPSPSAQQRDGLVDASRRWRSRTASCRRLPRCRGPRARPAPPAAAGAGERHVRGCARRWRRRWRWRWPGRSAPAAARRCPWRRSGWPPGRAGRPARVGSAGRRRRSAPCTPPGWR